MAKVPAEVGSTANRYQILGKLAVGGMAEIYLARGANVTGLERYCVLKRILRERAGDAQFVQMFLDEARLAAQLQHPNIAQVYDIGMLGDSYFFTMEYVHGETVRALLHRAQGQHRPIPLACVLTIIAGAAAGLHHAHERVSSDGRPLGIVHRDVSPSNLMVSHEGNVKIVDFGVAKAADRAIETKSGTVKGKISYLSPEQCRGHRVDRRSDLFSLGIVMWEMLTGGRLYRRTSDFENMTAIVNEPPPAPSSRRSEVPRAVDDIVLRLLAKSLADRFQTAGEVVEAIENASMRAGTILSTSAVSRLLRDLFGARAEPWLDLDTETMPFERVMLAARPLPGDLATAPLDPVEVELAAVPDLSVSKLFDDDLGDGSVSSEIAGEPPEPWHAGLHPIAPSTGRARGAASAIRAAGSIAPPFAAPGTPRAQPAAATRASVADPSAASSRAAPAPASPPPIPAASSALPRLLASLPPPPSGAVSTLLGVSPPPPPASVTTIRTSGLLDAVPANTTVRDLAPPPHTTVRDLAPPSMTGATLPTAAAATRHDITGAPTLVTAADPPIAVSRPVVPWPPLHATPRTSFDAMPRLASATRPAPAHGPPPGFTGPGPSRPPPYEPARAPSLNTPRVRDPGKSASRFTPRLIAVMVFAAAIGAITAWLTMSVDHRTSRIPTESAPTPSTTPDQPEPPTTVPSTTPDPPGRASR